MSGTLMGVAVIPLAPEKLTGLPYPERSLELGFPQVAIERQGGGYQTGPLYLRTSPMEAAVLALIIQDTIGAVAMAEARRLRVHGGGGVDTGVLLRVRDKLHVL
ncbi:hypothetical protein LO772_27650 [Yinghuangia sp. ASG 101]|uniref:hypothetical protein n=1 Tax=Yinghuangia sp. ASG 101 TaxID=2896848 RepID=UPI001E5B8DD1|nr:hypothetical protein [Yinghuangia sp. ASG 101]UGQ10586.1 hypothetical protein LO772_27650 [Yinghuangia sp. ASG 101]